MAERVSWLRHDCMVRLDGAGWHTRSRSFLVSPGVAEACRQARHASGSARSVVCRPHDTSRIARYIHAKDARWKKIFGDGMVSIEE
jgi:hypothetical protein